MTIQIQQGDVTDRLRRSLGVRGPLHPVVDETVSPTVNLGDIGQVPYALDPSHGAGSHVVTGQAANQGTIGIVNEGPEGSVFLVEQLIVSAAATILVEINRSGLLATGTAPLSSTQMADTTSQCRPGTTGRILPVRFVAWDLDVTIVGSICEMFPLVANQTLIVPVKHLLRRGEVCYVKTVTDGTLIRVGASGRFYAALGDTGA